jgi:hypothetical protein
MKGRPGKSHSRSASSAIPFHTSSRHKHSNHYFNRKTFCTVNRFSYRSLFFLELCGLTAGGQPVGLQPPVRAITSILQKAPRRPLSRLMTRTTKPTTRSKWISAPPICRLKPRSHKIRRTATIVQSMSTSCAHFEHPNVNLIQRPRENLYSTNGTRQ